MKPHAGMLSLLIVACVTSLVSLVSWNGLERVATTMNINELKTWCVFETARLCLTLLDLYILYILSILYILASFEAL